MASNALLLGLDNQIALWISDQLGTALPSDYTAIGVHRRGQIVAGCLYWCYRQRSMELTFAATTPRWASRSVIFALLSYPFVQCDCVRVQAVTSTTNVRAISALDRIGFQREGTLRKAHRDGDAYVYGLLRDEWELSPYGFAKPASST